MLPFSAGLFLGLAIIAQAQQFTNPVVYEDFSDNDVFLGPDGKTFYLSSSTFHYSPGAPILQSTDLVNWQIIGHSVPTLDFGSNYYMENNQTAYNGGIWASTLRHRKSNDQWYWIGCVNFWTTYVYTAPDVTGPWKQSASFQPCFYDCGLLIDDDDTMYVAYGGGNVSVAQLAADGLSIIQTRPVFSTPPECTGIEGNRMYKINGLYYVLGDCPAQGITLIWKSSNPFGPYERKILSNNTPSPIPGTGSADQGSLIETPNGQWYFMSFAWAYPLGRLPILAPVTWGSDGFPILTTVNGAWNESYPYPLPQNSSGSAWIGGDPFWGIGPAWEWNHNPDTTKFSLDSPGLTLQTATVTNDLTHARNTLTHRPNGQFPVGTLLLDFTNMADGDKCGLALLKDQSAWIGVVRSGNSYTITAVQGLIQDPNNNWATTSTGTIVGTVPISVGQIHLQVSMDARADGSKQAKFSYSSDGNSYTQLGGAFTLDTDYAYFAGYRFAIFNFATKALGGSIKVLSFVSWTF
ncbi:glycoside hydrolase family 43 protein [Oidiodendron maius Zn]|uniref:Glycoside hydrolase family 43 protein n=1 Tax=Oidiodendron maius (strain Zn) TaxID=913774 RepID=A0A0C3GCS9_OIDMZ|nr:glycoside hydrolase family 43 protein [Oidiodendron maius Zn]